MKKSLSTFTRFIRSPFATSAVMGLATTVMFSGAAGAADTTNGSGVNISPNSNLPGLNTFQGLVGGLITAVEVLCAAAFVVAAGMWAWSSHSGNHQGVSNGKKGLVTAVVALVLVASLNVVFTWATSSTTLSS